MMRVCANAPIVEPDRALIHSARSNEVSFVSVAEAFAKTMMAQWRSARSAENSRLVRDGRPDRQG